MKMILMRHGQTAWNLEGRLQGRTDIPLSEEGAKQAKKTGEKLAVTFPDIDLILQSPLSRARDTAQIVARALHYPLEKILTAPDFIERGFGEAEGLTYAAARTKYPDGRYPGMETVDELVCRARSAVLGCAGKYPDRTLLTVSHGAIIKGVLTAFSNGKILYHDNLLFDNGAICILEQQGVSWKITIPNGEDIKN